MKPIFLIGLPGCGKTTLGRALAKRLHCDFFDLDQYIESRFRCSVADMFASVGEQEFRRRESVMLREVGEMEDVIVACGGGTPCHSGNMDYISSRGTVVWLQASEPVLMRRIVRAQSRRPMFAACGGEEEILGRLRDLTARRSGCYAGAALHFCSDELEDRQMIDRSVDRFIQLINHPNTI